MPMKGPSSEDIAEVRSGRGSARDRHEVNRAKARKSMRKKRKRK